MVTTNYTIHYLLKKVALYCRVSTDGQTNDNQSIRLIEYANANKLQFDLYTEIESTRKTRPVKQELLSRLRNFNYSAVVVYKLDRWARSSAELILEINELLGKNIGFISIAENLDFTTATGKLHFQILSAFAEFERELIRERTKEGIRRAKLQGKIPGRPKGKKDSKPRKKSGYIMREANKRRTTDMNNGVFNPIQHYLD